MGFVGDVTTHQRKLVLHSECLPYRILYHRPGIAVRSRHKNDDRADCATDIRAPESELGHGVILTRSDSFIQSGALNERGKRKGKGKCGNSQATAKPIAP